ncbi:MAG: 1-deoxy-D-xylulose-5-phosphate reductoisomerase, partial [Clostridia bacterium]|nr:1-deoxy-D-xylulose-5-phosphate reductoisomerase [Clostridia bacterium]
MKNLAIIGSTGSIGTQALEVVDCFDDINVVALSANNSVELFAQQIRKYKPDIACIMNGSRVDELKALVNDINVKIVTGMDGLVEIAEYEKSDMLLTSVVGNVGLLPTVAAIRKGKKILLANKETLVTAGELIIPLAKEYNV